MDWQQMGAILGTTVASALFSGWSLIKSRNAESRSKEAKVASHEARQQSAATVEVISPRGDQPTLYDNVVQIRDSITGLSAVLRENRTEYLTAIAEVKRDVQDLRTEANDRLKAVETAVSDHHLMERRMTQIEASVRLLAAPAVVKNP